MATAKASRLLASDALLKDCVDRAGPVVREVGAQWPAEFPESVAAPIFRGLETAAERLGSLADPNC